MPVKTLDPTHVSFLELSNAPALLQLGAPRFSKAEQDANPEEPMTRLVTDILRVGNWKVGEGDGGEAYMWNVTLQTLERVMSNFKLGKQRGLQFNFIWGHGDPITKIVDARDNIAPIDDVLLANGRLWATTYVTPAVAKQLKNPANQVSVRIVDSYKDGQAREYDLMLLHVGVVDTPVVDEQYPFIDMSNLIRDLTTQGKTMDFAKLVELLNKLLGYSGLALPEDVTEETLVDVLTVILATIDQVNGTPAETPASPPAETPPVEAPVEPPAGGDMSNTIAALLRPMQQQLVDLSNVVNGLKTGTAKAKYEEVLMDLSNQGKITPALQQQWLALGPQLNYNVLSLEPLKSMKSVDMSNVSKAHRSGNAPKAPGSGLSDDQVKEGAALLK